MAVARDDTRRYGRSAGLLSGGIGAAGLLTYVYFSLASHNLEAAEYGEIVVLWSAVFIGISVLYRPVEQLLSRTIAEHRARDEPIGGPLRTAAMIQATIALACGAVMLALREPIEDELLSGETTLYWVLLVALLAFAASFYARGFLAGERRFALLSALLVCESTSRMAFALAVALGIAGGQELVALGIAAAPLFSLLVVPLAFGHRAVRGRAARKPGSGGGELSLAHGSGFAAAVLCVMLSEQILISAGPLLLRGLVDAAAAGFIFNVLMLARAPLIVFQGVATSLLPHLTRLRARSEGEGDGAEFAASVTLTLRAVAAFTAFVLLVVAVAGPTLMQLAFGDRFTYDRAGLLIVGLGMGLYLSATTLNQAVLAQGQARRAAACWLACALGFLVWSLVVPIDEFRRIETGFTLAAAVLAVLLWLVYRRPRARPGEALRPGSPEEIEARLAAADEAS